MPTCIKWVVALRPEAQAIIERFRLEPVSTRGRGFPIFSAPDGSMDLVVSGPGKVSAAAATSYLLGETESSGAGIGWINFGIAGSGGGDYGKTFLGNRIVETSGDGVWYPIATWSKKVDLERREIRTVDLPTRIYPPSGELVEMEAAGFYPTAVRFSSSELCQVMKVVSDDPEHSMEEINKSQVVGLAYGALEQAEGWLEGFRDVLEEEWERGGESEEFTRLIKELHFSVTQQHQLRRLLQERKALGLDLSEQPRWKGARECLQVLRSDLTAARAHSGNSAESC